MSTSRIPTTPASALLGLAWATILLVSAMPDILFDLLAGAVPSWLPAAKGALVAALAIAGQVRPSLRPLRNFAIVMVAFFAFAALRPHLDFTLPPLQALFGASAFDSRMQAEQTGKLAVSGAMILVLVALGYPRREFFLTLGQLRAPIRPVPLLGFPKACPWPQFGLQWGCYIAATLAVIQYLGLRPDGAAFHQVVPLLPSIVFYAALNAFNEEVTYRTGLLATLETAVGGTHALWMAAWFFGIAHYFGTPGGLGGGLASIFMGWILGKAMLETRGLFWPWWIHFLSDVAIFVFLGVTLVR